mmetsp:Transcript_85862/g.170424  ORF Transcript_85862/g.170424 Transcript_85862/m.170424 type:complete len:110 (+) Transcript_85862:335-664(+)
MVERADGTVSARSSIQLLGSTCYCTLYMEALRAGTGTNTSQCEVSVSRGTEECSRKAARSICTLHVVRRVCEASMTWQQLLLWLSGSFCYGSGVLFVLVIAKGSCQRHL